MKSRFPMMKQSLMALTLLAGMLTATVAFAQDPGGPPPPFGGPAAGGQGGPGGPPAFGRPPFGGPRQNSAVDLPMETLASALNLSDDQKTKIAAIQDEFRQQNRRMMFRPGERPSGPPPDFQSMQAKMQKVNQRIEAVLDDKQKAELPGVLKTVNTMRSAGIPVELYGKLKLTSDQKQKLTEINEKAQKEMRHTMETAQANGDFEAIRQAMDKNRQQTQEKVMAALTDEQRALIEQFRKDHPRPTGRPGRGPGGQGPGGPPPGGPGEDGQGGPPPPGGPGTDGQGAPPPPGGPGTDGQGAPPPPGGQAGGQQEDAGGPPPPTNEDGSGAHE